MADNVDKMCKLVLLMQMLLLTPALISAMDQSSVTPSPSLAANATASPIKDFENLLLISDMLDLFNLASVGRKWFELSQRVTPRCSKDMTDYLYGLETKKLWAIKSKLLLICLFENLFYL